ncbi:armadillo repeat-containing protein 5-like isoform X1 [Salvelinus fontinalis]|uniref:armadillo repeat-containing protein 5-like isoform X1 n=2 Tax=Salvelinus fontinalis TaxID=8038 RepID=UPI002486A051|nr:armadillo repeat-containing protein 5-like isoform X1 [Salvelinus fontinalis]XP_055754007.1 armadillo repeat-containing protein 5-like isoform X1 [Salvelinus fontinalis]
MASKSVPGIQKHGTCLGNPREVASASPETSLTWCLSQLSKPGRAAAEDHKPGTAGPDTSGHRQLDKRVKAGQWRALVAIRTQHIKGGSSGIARFRGQGGLRTLLDLLKHPECSRKTLDLVLSILANCCTERQTRVEVRKLHGISIVVGILKKNVAMETIQNRAARALGNLAMDPESSTLIHSAGGVPLLLLCVSLASAPSPPSDDPLEAPSSELECAQSAVRALLYLADTPSNRLLLLTQGTLTALAPLIAPEYPLGLRRAALRTLHELTRSCGVECAREVSRSGVLAQLGVMASGEAAKPFEELALKTLANMCTQGCLRPLVGSLGVIQKFTEEVKKDGLKSGVFLKALCLCCKEAVNRAKVKESGGLEVLIGFLGVHRSHPLDRLVILACVDFVYDEAALEQLQELGIVPLLVARLVELAKGEEPSAGKMDVSLTSTMFASELLSTSCFDSFDFPPPEGNRKEEMGKEHVLGSSSFLSLRSWLVSEGLISSEGDLLDSPGGTEGDWGSLHISSSSPQTSSTNCHSPLKCLSPTRSLPSSTPLSAPKSRSQSTPSTSTGSPAQVHMSYPSKTADLSPCVPLPSSTSTPQVQPSSSTSTPQAQPSSSTSTPQAQPSSSTSTPQAQPSSSTSTPQAQPSSSISSLPSPTIPPLTSVSPSKFSSPPRKWPRVPSTTRSSVVPLDTPPTVSRPQAYHHPYHPEPWAPESPILLLLSRFSHATDPSAALVNSGIISGLLFYLSQHQDPSGRCFRMLCRLSCNPNCLQALVRTGSVALIRHHLVQRGSDPESWGAGERQTDRVKAKVKQLGLALLSNLRVQCESGFGSGVLSHVMLSGSESDKLNCALSLPLINGNKALLKKLLLDNGGLLLALEPLGCNEDEEEEDHHTSECRRLLSDCLNSPQHVSAPQLHSLYFSLLIGCLSSLMGCPKTVLAKRRCRVLSPIKPLSVSQTGKASPPPLKKPRLVNICPYNDSTFDLLFLLDDGSQVSANREAVAGAEGTEVVGSEYFRALLRGGFGEAQGRTGEAIPIRDVSQGMLLPVLHYLHGCRLNKDGETAEEQGDEMEREGRGECQILGSLASEGLGVWRDGAEEPSPEAQGFQKTPLAETMMGACRFLVTELQREVEDLCVSLLSCSAKNAGRIADVGKKPPSNMDQYGSEGESADESLANRTSGLELSGSEGQTDSLAPTVTAGQAESLHGSGLQPCQQTEGRRHSAPGPGQKGNSAPKTTSGLETCVNPLKSSSASKCCKRRFKLRSVSNTQKVADSVQDSKVGPGRWTLLPQVYWFSQRYSYPELGRACLSLLLGSQGSSQPRPSSLAADCLRRLAREADCIETLKRDLVSLATMALS